MPLMPVMPLVKLQLTEIVDRKCEKTPGSDVKNIDYGASGVYAIIGGSGRDNDCQEKAVWH